MLERATRDRRPLGHDLAGGLRQSDATNAEAGEYTDAIDPDSERWYSIDVPVRDTLSVAATLAAPPTGDLSAVGSSLELQLVDSELKVAGSATSTNLFSFQPDRAVTLNSSITRARAGRYRIHVALRDSPDKQLATKLGGRPLPLELVFQITPPRVTPAPTVPPSRPKGADVSWPAAAGGASPGASWDALQTGSSVYYRVHVPQGTAPKATVTLDLGALDPAEIGGSSLDVKVYDALLRPVAEGQSLGPGDPTTHVKTATAAAPRGADSGGDWYVSAQVNDFLPDGAPAPELPLGVSVALPSKAAVAPQPQAVQAGGGSGTSWALFAALCVSGAALGVLGGAALRRR